MDYGRNNKLCYLLQKIVYYARLSILVAVAAVLFQLALVKYSFLEASVAPVFLATKSNRNLPHNIRQPIASTVISWNVMSGVRRIEILPDVVISHLIYRPKSLSLDDWIATPEETKLDTRHLGGRMLFRDRAIAKILAAKTSGARYRVYFSDTIETGKGKKVYDCPAYNSNINELIPYGVGYPDNLQGSGYELGIPLKMFMVGFEHRTDSVLEYAIKLRRQRPGDRRSATPVTDVSKNSNEYVNTGKSINGYEPMLLIYWPAVIGNIAIVAGTLWITLSVLLIKKTRSRWKAGLCVACGYARLLQGSVCSECGMKYK